MKENKRILYFDVLNIMACFCVILMHHNGIVHFFSDTMQWKQALIVEVVAYWAVPVFFMLTGATLLDYSERYDTKTFFKKRVFPYVNSIFTLEYNFFSCIQKVGNTFI